MRTCGPGVRLVRSRIEAQKEACLGRLKMDYVEEQMSEHLVELEGLIRDYEQLGGLIGAEKGYVERVGQG